MYRNVYPNEVTWQEARQRLRLRLHQRTLLFIGVIAKYKNVPLLATVFRRLDDPETQLVIAGRFDSKEDEAATRDAADGDARIQIHSGYVQANDLQIYFNAADLVVLPFREILHSGSALLALSFDKPVLVPALGAMPELQATFGSDWVRTYKGELTPEELNAALEWSRMPNRPKLVHASSLSWEEIARGTLRAYTEILGHSDLTGVAR
jgi:glycosyltransferase involved in cell wall biosynthesis